MTPAPSSAADPAAGANAKANAQAGPAPGASPTPPAHAADPDPKHQAEDVLAQVSDMIGAALLGIRVRSGDPNTLVHSGYPCTVITTDKPAE